MRIHAWVFVLMCGMHMFPGISGAQSLEQLAQTAQDKNDECFAKAVAHEPADVEGFAQALLAYSRHPEAAIDIQEMFAAALFRYIRESHAGERREAAIIKSLNASSSHVLRRFALGKEQVLKLRAQPLGLSVPAFAGEAIDLASLRGKVVLVDVWSLNCSSCIDAMPALRTLHDRYRERGFEIVGVCLVTDEAREKRKAEAVLDKTGATAWRNGLLIADAERAFRERYSITGVPVTWLLDRNGLLVANAFQPGELEAKLRSLLGNAE